MIEILFLIGAVLILGGAFAWADIPGERDGEYTEEFYPPMEFESAMAEQSISNKISERGIVSAILSLAVNGYIKIVKDNNRNTLITMQKEYRGSNRFESLIFEEMFKQGEETVDNNSIVAVPAFRVEERINEFKLFLTAMAQQATDSIKDDIIISGCGRNGAMLWGIAISVFLSAECYMIGGSKVNAGYYLFIFFGCSALFASYFKDNNYIIGKCMMGLWIVFAIFMAAGSISSLNKLFLFLTVVLTLATSFVIQLKKVRCGRDRIVLRNFLKTIRQMQTDRLKNRQKLLPEYFYEVLPYMYSLGKSDMWFGKYRDINMEIPEWYEDNNVKDFNEFGKSITETLDIFLK